MSPEESPYLTLGEARSEVDRYLAKAHQQGQVAAVVVVDSGGNVVSASRMDDAAVATIRVARQRVIASAVETYGSGGGEVIDGQYSVERVLKGGRVVGAVGMEAVRSPDAVSPLPLTLDEARRFADRAIREAGEVGSPIGVAVVDELGRLLQVDRMDDSPLVSCDLAEAKAMTALKFRRPTTTLTEEFRGHSARLRAIEKLVGFTLLAMGGGIPIEKDGRLVGAIGVSGSGGGTQRGEATRSNDSDIARVALYAS